MLDQTECQPLTQTEEVLGGELYVRPSGLRNDSVSVWWYRDRKTKFPATGNACASNMLLDNGDWYINRVLIQPEDFRAQGLGGILLERLKREVALAGAKRLLVEPGGYNSSIPRLHKFYRAHGFKRQRQGCFVWECGT